jgi:hypothetical protein
MGAGFTMQKHMTYLQNLAHVGRNTIQEGFTGEMRWKKVLQKCDKCCIMHIVAPENAFKIQAQPKKMKAPP